MMQVFKSFQEFWNYDETQQGIICVVNKSEFEAHIEPGSKVAEVVPAALQTRVCQNCGAQDTDAVPLDDSKPKCAGCGVQIVEGVSPCTQCGAGADESCLLSYAGCTGCRP